MAAAAGVLQALYQQTESGELSEDGVNRFLLVSWQDEGGTPPQMPELILKHARLRAYGTNQQRYLSAMQEHDLVFGVGPAGTGKTYLAIAQAIRALEQDLVERIVLVRPVLGDRRAFGLPARRCGSEN